MHCVSKTGSLTASEMTYIVLGGR